MLCLSPRPFPCFRTLLFGHTVSFHHFEEAISFLLLRYEGTGRSLSLKLIDQLRAQSAPLASGTTENSGNTSSSRILTTIVLNESIRYSPGDEVELWLNNLLCLDATVVPKFSSGCPLPDACDLYPFVALHSGSLTLGK